mgnify:CR=1 FL=1
MVYTVRFHPLVQQDFSEAYVWYEEKQKGLGERFLQSVRLKIEEISIQPQTYGSRSRKLFREAQVDFFPYLIVFKICSICSSYKETSGKEIQNSIVFCCTRQPLPISYSLRLQIATLKLHHHLMWSQSVAA